MSATNVARAGKRGNIWVGNNVSATMCPRLPGPLCTHGRAQKNDVCSFISAAKFRSSLVQTLFA